MYRFFTLNYNNYKSMNKVSDTYRDLIDRPISLLADINSYIIHEKDQDDLYRETTNLISHLSSSTKNYPRLKTFVNDLTYLGFKSRNFHEFSKDLVEDQIKLVDLLLSFTYTY